jgi:oligopeptidase B
MVTSSCRINDEFQAPDAKKIKKVLTVHNENRTDNYYWLKEKENPDVIQYLEDENMYTENSLLHTKSIQDEIFTEISERIQGKDISVPYKDNGYYYYQRYEEGKEHPIYCRKAENSETEEVLLNVNELSEGYPYYHISDFSISENNKLMAFSVDTIGNLQYEIRIKNLETGLINSERIQNTDGESEWASDNLTLFYVKNDLQTNREYQLWKHTLGEDPNNDQLIYEETDETFTISVFKSKSDKIIFLGSFNTVTTEYRYIFSNAPEDEFKVLLPRERGHEYYAAAHGKNLYLLTNKDHATNFKIVKAEFSNPQDWTEVLPHNNTILIEDFELFKNYLVVHERKEGLVQLRIINLEDKSEHYLECKDEVRELWISDNDEYNSETLRYGYSSLTTPSTYYDYNMRTKEQVLLKQKFAGKDYNSENYVSKRLYAKSNDGEMIPISLVYRKELKKNGENPMVIYGYGAYGISTDAYFQPAILSLLDRGFIYAVAHVRGGQELGREWYEEGKLLKKQNSFNDFIACVEFLHKQKYSTADKTFAYGSSAGGLLIGAVANMRPELFLGIIAEVPFVDPLTTMLDNKIPLTTGEFDEWGNPKIREYYDYILSYSPYDQIKKQDYPAMFITAGFNDSQVQYWEPVKWTAKLRDFNTSNKPIYLTVSMESGHGGMTGRYSSYKETALIYAFMLDQLSN